MTSTEKTGKKYYLQYWLIYTLLFAVTTTGVFFFFIKNGRGLLWESDGLSLYIPRAYYFIEEVKTFFAKLLQGRFELPMYDFSMGMGDATYVHFEPLYWLYLLFDQSHVELAFNILFILRFYLAGLAMSAYVLYFHNSRTSALLGSFAYLYTEFSLGSASRHSQFVIPMIMLPLCFLVVEEIMKNRRWYLCTILVWVHLWCGFYFLYMNTIATCIYFFVRFFVGAKDRSFINFINKCLTIGSSYLLGVIIGNIVLLNTFASYLTSSRSVTEASSGGLDHYLLYGNTIARIYKFINGFLTLGQPVSSGIRLGFVPLLYLAAVMAFLYWGNWERKIFLLISTAFCFIPLAAYTFSGFDSTTYRWSYIYGFVLAANLSFELDHILHLDLKRKLLVTASAVPFFLLFAYHVLKGKRSVKYLVIVSAISLFLAVVSIWIANWKKISWRKKCAVLIAAQTIALWGLGAQQFAGSMGNLTKSFPKAGHVLEQALATPLAVTSQIEDDSFYRVATNESRFGIKGAALMLGYHSTVYDQNTAMRHWTEFYQKMGLSQWTLVRKRGFNGRSFLEALADVKYFIIKQGNESDVPYGFEPVQTIEDKDTYTVYESPYTLPLGYTYAHTITAEQLDAYPTVNRPEILMQAAVTETSNTSDMDFAVTGDKVEILDISCTNATFEDGTITLTPKKGESARIDITFAPQKNCELYLCMNDMYRTGSNKENVWYGTDIRKEKYQLHGKGNSYYTSQKDYIFPLGYYEEEVGSCYFTTDTKMTLRIGELCVYAQPMDALGGYTDALKENVLENVEVGQTTVSGTIHLDEDKYLVLSIPYRNGWTAYVDGEKTQLEYANILYMGMPLTKGDHTIELKFATPGLRYSLMASALGLLIFALACILTRRFRRSGTGS